MLEHIDLTILYFCNHDLANPIFDFLFAALSDSRIFIWPLLILLIVILWQGGTKARLAIILTVICIAITDPTTHYILKNIFARLRPCHTLDDLRLIVNCGGLYGFPSNHAANSFAAAAILSAFYRRYTALFAMLAALIGFSRIYLGKHYLSDVLAGAFWGLLLACLILYLAKIIISRLPANGFWKGIKNVGQGVLIWKNPRTRNL